MINCLFVDQVIIRKLFLDTFQNQFLAMNYGYIGIRMKSVCVRVSPHLNKYTHLLGIRFDQFAI